MTRRPITNSERASFSCRQLWMWRYGLGYRPEQAPRAIGLGNCVHSALDAYWHGGAQDLTAAMDAVEAWRASQIEASKASLFAHEDKDEEIDSICSSALCILARYHAHWCKRRTWEVLFVEAELTAQTPEGPVSGKVDKIVRDERGRIMIVDHKTTSIELDRWRSLNDYSPQLVTYAWLAREALGLEVEGLLHDVILTRDVLPASDIPRNKDGSLRKWSPDRLPATTADQWRAALADQDPAEWHAEVTAALEKRDQSDYWFGEQVQFVTADEIDRTELELTNVARDIHWHDDLIAPYRARIEAGEDERAVVVDAAFNVGPVFARNQGDCRKYGRRCEYMGACRYGERPEAMIRLNSPHAELSSANDEGEE